MKKEILELIKALEREYGCPVQISVEKPKETEIILFTGMYEGQEPRYIFPFENNTYGALENRACEVLPLPTHDEEIRHDLGFLKGSYDSLKAVNEKIGELKELEHLCFNPSDFHEGLRQYLAEKYVVEEKVVSAAHGSKADWYTVDGVEADLGSWRKDRPDLYQASLFYLKNNNIPFKFHYLTATPSGIYIDGGIEIVELDEFFDAEGIEAYSLTQKIADIKLEFLK